MAKHLQRSPAEIGVLTGVMFGGMNGLILAVISVPFLVFTGPFLCVGVPLVFLVVAPVLGVPFGVTMGMVARAVTVMPSVRDGETLVAWGGANLSGNGGMLGLSDQRLWFATHAMNLARPDFDLPLAEIERVDGKAGLLSGILVIESRAGARHKLRVDFAPEWAGHIQDGVPLPA